MLAIWLRCFCSSSVGMVNEKIVKGSEFPKYLTVSAFLDLCRSGTDRVQHRDRTARAVQVTDEYQGSKMLLLDLSAVFDALRYC